jgi:hypothetical protein
MELKVIRGAALLLIELELQTKDVTVLVKESHKRQRMVVGLKEQL